MDAATATGIAPGTTLPSGTIPPVIFTIFSLKRLQRVCHSPRPELGTPPHPRTLHGQLRLTPRPAPHRSLRAPHQPYPGGRLIAPLSISGFWGSSFSYLKFFHPRVSFFVRPIDQQFCRSQNCIILTLGFCNILLALRRLYSSPR